VSAHGGKVEILDSRGQGAHFQVRLPKAAATVAASAR
jgi:signal transduction histidine kinase